MKRLTITSYALVLIAASAIGSEAQEPPAANARLIDAAGREVGSVRLLEAPTRGVLMRIEVSGLGAGMHAIHFHETGRCEPPAFASAGGRLGHREDEEGVAPSRAAGRAVERMSLRVPGEGRIEVERLAPRMTLTSGLLNSLFDDDGSAILIYAGPDGEARGLADAEHAVVCGVIRR